jgi:Putative zinc-finger
MRCDECLTLLDQYVEDELDEVTAKSLTAHMSACPECAGAHGALRREQEMYASYLLDVEPSRHLWSNLRLELNKENVARESRSPFQRWLAAVLGDFRFTPQLATALLLIIIGLTIGMMVWRTTNDAPNNQTQNPGVGVRPSSDRNLAAAPRDFGRPDHGASADNGGRILRRVPKSGNRGREIQISAAGRTGRRAFERTRAVSTVDQVTQRAEQQYLAAIEMLSRDINRHRTIISPSLRSQLDTALADVDRNIAATRKVAREQPRDPVAVQYLALAYEKKIELLREVTNW